MDNNINKLDIQELKSVQELEDVREEVAQAPTAKTAEQLQEYIDTKESQIEPLLIDFYSTQGMDDIRSAPQATWSAAMTYIKNALFKPNKILKLHEPNKDIKNIDYNDIKINNPSYRALYQYSNNQAYNIYIVNVLCDYYIYLCQKYDKMVSIMDFSRLSNIDYNIFYVWDTKDVYSKLYGELSGTNKSIVKRLDLLREESLAAKLASNKNPVATMAILNKCYSWNMPGVRAQEGGGHALTAANLPRIANNSGTIHGIEQGENVNTGTNNSNTIQ